MSKEPWFKSLWCFLIIMTLAAVLMDWFWATSGTRVPNIALDLVSPILGVALIPFIGKRAPWMDVVVFIMIIPLFLAGFAWAPAVQSEGHPVALYLFGLIAGAGNKHRRHAATNQQADNSNSTPEMNGG